MYSADWYSDKNTVGYFPYDGSYYFYNQSTNSTFTNRVRAGLAAGNTWENVLPISVFEASANYAIFTVHGGTESQLSSMFPDLSSSMLGLTNVVGTRVDTAYYNGKPILVQRLNAGGRICIVDRTGFSADQYKMATKHEMGHMFGWLGHSSNSSDLMYLGVTNSYGFTARDKNHITQVYDLYF